MGACFPAQKRDCSFLLKIPGENGKLWKSILNHSFDSDALQFVLEIQDIHVTTLGEYLTPRKVAVLVLELKKFLFVLGLSMKDEQKEEFKEKMAPSPIIDRLWRLLLTSSLMYQDFCKSLFNKELIRSSRHVLSLVNYDATRNKLVEYFGELNETVWPRYETETKFKQAHKGFVRLKVADFFAFHQYFTALVGAKDPLKRPSLKRELQNLKECVTINDGSQSIKQLLEGKRKHIWKRQRASMSLAEPENHHFKSEGFSPPKKQNVHSLIQNKLKSECKHFKKDKPMKQQISQIDIEDVEEIPEPQADSDFENEGEDAYKPKKQQKISFVSDQPQGLKIKRALKKPTRTSIKIFLKNNWLEIQNNLEKEMMSHPISETIMNNFMSQICVEDIDLIFDEYKRYMILRELTVSKYRVIAPHIIEIAHNFHIAESKDYRSFCKHLFHKKMSRVYLPRQIEEKHRQEYITTLQLYQLVFKMPPSKRIWPQVEERLDLDQVYNYKYFDVVGYMTAIMNQAKYRGLQRPWESSIAKKALNFMEVLQQPKRGEDYLNLKEDD